jgi:hypothetical protein
MNEMMKFLTTDTQVWGYNLHNWMLIAGGVVVLWIIVLAKDA